MFFSALDTFTSAEPTVLIISELVFIKFAPDEIKLNNPENNPSPLTYGMFVVAIVSVFK